MLQTFGSNPPYGPDQFGLNEDRGQAASLEDYLRILKRRIFYFLLPFTIVGLVGLYFAANQQPTYHSEAKVLVESQEMAPDLVRPIVTATAGERLQVIQQRTVTRDNLLSIANKLGLFPDEPSSTVRLDLMQQAAQIKLVDLQGPNRPDRSAGATIAFTVGFDYENPELAMRAATELLTLILNEDVRTRTGQAAETIKILQSEVKDVEERLDANQAQILSARQRPRELVPDIPEQEKLQMAALAALRDELIQKSSVYSDSHPAIVSLKRRIAAMEKSMAQPAAPRALSKAQEPQADDLVVLQGQREVLQKRLEEANSKLAVARLGENLERDQQSNRFQVIEPPTLPQRPLKSGRLKLAAIAFAAAAMAGFGGVLAAETLDKSIRGGHELVGIVDRHLITSLPFIETHTDVLRKRRRIMWGVGIVILVALTGVAAAVSYFVPAEAAWRDLLSPNVLNLPGK